jgi:hypothetical protein
MLVNSHSSINWLNSLWPRNRQMNKLAKHNAMSSSLGITIEDKMYPKAEHSFRHRQGSNYVHASMGVHLGRRTEACPAAGASPILHDLVLLGQREEHNQASSHRRQTTDNMNWWIRYQVFTDSVPWKHEFVVFKDSVPWKHEYGTKCSKIRHLENMNSVPSVCRLIHM